MKWLQRYQNQLANQRWLIILTIMMVAILEVLDSTIVNVALPDMMPSLGANQQQITWVLTSYVVASAMMLPLTGFLSTRFGYKRLLLVNISGFMISSLLCGTTQSLAEMVVFRLLQGAFGAAMIPLSQSILRQTFPLEEQGKAMAIWGIGIMAAPVFGPTLGGFITQNASWRWIFYVNVPICFIALLLTWLVIPWGERIKQKIDWLGIALMFIGVGLLQIFLDQGNSHNWFQSNFILLLAVISVVCLTLFIIRCLLHHHPLIKLAIFKDRNFTLCTIILVVYAGGLFGMITLQPIMLETLFHYPTVTAGLTMAPIGIASAIGMVFSSSLMNHVNVKWILVSGLVLCAAGMYYMSGLNLNAAQINIVYANTLQGAGLGLTMVPLSTYALATIAKKDITEASGLFSYGRMLGSSIGISLLSTLVSRVTQKSWNQLGANISPLSNHLRIWLSEQHLTLQSHSTLSELSSILLRQANMLAFLNAYFVITIAFLVLIPLILMMKHVQLQGH